jgi:hypothetical protein
MMVTRALVGDVKEALTKAVDQLGWTTIFVDSEQRKMELHRDISLFSWGDDIKVHLVEIDPVIVVHVQSRMEERLFPLGEWKGHHIKNERRLLETMIEDLGKDVSHILD